MNCHKAFEQYLLLDKVERVPLGVTVHLLFCPVCRTSVRKLTLAEQVLAAPLALQSVLPDIVVVDPVVAAALLQIRASGLAWPDSDVNDQHVSLFRWIISGVVLAAGFAIIPFSAIGSWSGLVFGPSFIVPLYLLCGIAVTGWCGIFIGSNIDFFVKKFGIEQAV